MTTDPYRISEDSPPPAVARRGGVRPVLWLLLVISAAGNVVTSNAGVNVLSGSASARSPWRAVSRWASTTTVTGADEDRRRARPPAYGAGHAAVAMANVTKTYAGGVRALDDVSLTVERGTFLAVMGPSGSGKSTLMHCAAGLDSPTGGSVSIDGTPIVGLNETRRTELRRERVGFVFQSYNLVPSLSVADNITLPLRLAGTKPDRAWLRTLVERVGLAGRLEHRPAELSGGQQQRAAIARALVTRPAVVFGDEPTGALDLRTAREVLGLLRDLVDGLGQTVVMVTHDPAAAARADRALVMADGRIVDTLGAAHRREPRPPRHHTGNGVDDAAPGVAHGTAPDRRADRGRVRHPRRRRAHHGHRRARRVGLPLPRAGRSARTRGHRRVGPPDVRPTPPTCPIALPERARVPGDLAARLARLPGVTAAIGDVSLPAAVLDRHGAVVPAGDPRTAGHGWSSTGLLDGPPVTGTAPAGPLRGRPR